MRFPRGTNANPPRVKDYLLFIDIESSGLPQDWEAPYAKEGNWPHTVQVAWFVYTKGGELVKQEDHFIRPEGFEVTPASIAVHHLTPEFLRAHGKGRAEVLAVLQQDLQQYQPMVVGHFMEFDYHVLSADFFREGWPNPFTGLPQFCTMAASSELILLPHRKYLRLGELYTHLFHKTLQDQHNAVVDARATAECYFELRKRRVITDATVTWQQQNKNTRRKAARPGPRLPRWVIWALALALTVLLLFYLL
ncbi:3'-5' exonuclease [Rufibacter psychrotolerans]|uniref:3'-5' exonuclease n=1 Tax=Rufibacter psychrotolerans TaxID=2812556 RepID=UPI0019689B8E|nr:3'-5' exonuclease [Rufibacter sp. SYSU D00308]